MKRLIRYSETPQVTGLEYNEVFYLEKHPENRTHFEMIVKYRRNADKSAYIESMKGLRNDYY